MLHTPLTLAVIELLIVATVAGPLPAADPAPARPNILWITCEDINPHLGCYGDHYATSPNIDRLASRGLVYLNCWSNAPVCAPARTTIITGVYPPSTGAEHMRSLVRMPPQMKMYPQMLREAGYYCTNNVKEDFNLVKPDGVWDELSTRAHWRNRPAGKPFFAVFNLEQTHESRIRHRPHQLVHDPAKVRLPAYHPDTPEVRHDWAQYYDNITVMDAAVGKRLKELDEAGLAEDTIVFFYGDHGSGMPRSKRCACDSGLHAPLVIHIPEKFRHLASKDYRPGAKTDRLVAFVDLAPTLLSLVGVKPPDWVQGHAFLGRHEAPPQPYLYGFRGRMDERYDLVRAVRDKRYVYLRNYMPHLPQGQHVEYMFQTPTTRMWKQLFDAGKLTPAQARFWQPKPPEELFDLETDPDEVRNLADSPSHQEIVARLRKAQQDWALSIRDVGFLPESEIHSRSQGRSPYEVGHDSSYPLERILATANEASSLRGDVLPTLKTALRDPDSAVRYWGAMGFLMRGKQGVEAAREELHAALADPSPSVRVAAAQALGQFGAEPDAAKALPVLVSLASCADNGLYVSLMALNAIDAMGPRAAPAMDRIRSLPKSVKPGERAAYGITRLIEKITASGK